MSEPIEVVSLAHCLHCDGVLVHPDPGPGGVQYNAYKYAMTKRLVWSEDIEMWVCPDCETPEWDAYIEPEVQQHLSRFWLDADKIDWGQLNEEKAEIQSLADQYVEVLETLSLIHYAQTVVVDSGIKTEEEVFNG